jgi:hypothetical protein
MTRLPVTFRFDDVPLAAAFDELDLRFAEAGELGREVGVALLRAIEAGEQLVAFQNDLPPATEAAADETIVRAYPSDGLARLVSALRAGNFDALIVEQAFGHDSGSDGGLDPAIEDAAPDESQGSSGANDPSSTTLMRPPPSAGVG